MSDSTPLYLDPEHRHAELRGTPEVCECGALLAIRDDCVDRHDQPLWWWWLPDLTLFPYPDPRPQVVMDDPLEQLGL